MSPTEDLDYPLLTSLIVCLSRQCNTNHIEATLSTNETIWIAPPKTDIFKYAAKVEILESGDIYLKCGRGNVITNNIFLSGLAFRPHVSNSTWKKVSSSLHSLQDSVFDRFLWPIECRQPSKTNENKRMGLYGRKLFENAFIKNLRALNSDKSHLIFNSFLWNEFCSAWRYIQDRRIWYVKRGLEMRETPGMCTGFWIKK